MASAMGEDGERGSVRGQPPENSPCVLALQSDAEKLKELVLFLSGGKPSPACEQGLEGLPHFDSLGAPSAPTSFGNKLSTALGGGGLVLALTIFISRNRAGPINSRGSKDGGAESASDGKVKGRRAMQAPDRHIDICRAPSASLKPTTLFEHLMQSRGSGSRGDGLEGSSRREAANARCAATAMRPLQRATYAAAAEERTVAWTLAERARARSRRKVTASVPHRPPTSRPNTTKRQRRARCSSG